MAYSWLLDLDGEQLQGTSSVVASVPGVVLGRAAVPHWADAGPLGVAPGSRMFVAPAVSLVEVMVFFFAREFFSPPVPSCVGFEKFKSVVLFSEF